MADAGSHQSPGRVPELSAAELMREQRLQRNLKIVIAALSLMIVGGLAAIIIRIVTMPPTSATASAAAGAATSAAPATLPIAASGQPIGDIALELPDGAKIVSVSVASSRLAVHYDGPAGTGIAVIDLETGRRIATIKPTVTAPR